MFSNKSLPVLAVPLKKSWYEGSFNFKRVVLSLKNHPQNPDNNW